MTCFIFSEVGPHITSESANANVSTSEDSTTDSGTSEVFSPEGNYGTTNQIDNEGSSSTLSFESTHSISSIATEDTPSPEKIPETPTKYIPPSHGVDYPQFFQTPKPPKKRPERVNSETSEIVALIIGIIAGALIAIILIILVILKFKSRGDRSYKVDDGKGYQQGPNAALLGNAASTNGQTPYSMNGALRNGDRGQVAKSKKRDSKDIKEWYV